MQSKLTHQFWIPFDKKPIEQPLLFSGVLLFKQQSQKLIEETCFLYEDKLIAGEYYCNITTCILRRTNQGFKLTCQKIMEEFFTRLFDDAERWFNILKRYTIQSNFNRDFKLLQRLTYMSNQGLVYLAKKIINNQNYNVKVIEKNSKLDSNKLLQELSILRKMKHKTIINLSDVYEDQANIYLVFHQYLGCEINYRYEEILSSTETMIAKIIYKLLEAIHHIHSHNVIHGNICLDNIYLKTDKLFDLCLANFSQAEYITNMHKNIKGAIGYQAPELYNNQKYDQQIDIYSLGIILYYFTYQEMPFSEFMDHNDNSQGKIRFGPTKNTPLSLDLLQQMLNPDPTRRIKTQDALKHQWFIQMKVQEKLTKSFSLNHRNLPTILEKSDIFAQSPVSKKSENVGIFEDEFHNISLSDKMKNLKSNFAPSKSNHDIFDSNYIFQ